MSEIKKRVPRISKNVDSLLVVTLFLIIAFGLIMVYSSSFPEASRLTGSTDYFIKRQLVFMLIGAFFMFLVSNYDYRNYKKLWVVIFIFTFALNALTFTSLGNEEWGATRWVTLLGVRFMPSDLIKIGSIIALSAYLSDNRKTVGSFNTTVKALGIVALSTLVVILQKDLSTSMVLAVTLLIIAFIGGIKIIYFVFAGAGVGALLAYAIIAEPFRMERLLAFRDPFKDRLGTGMQAVQSLYALGSGGFTGVGLGKSVQKYFYLPLCYNDFIFSIIGEELGLIGTFLYICLLGFFVFQGISISMRVKDPFGKYLAFGISTLIAVQSMVHILVSLSSLPTTGITLPYVSYGGTSLVIFMIAAGILFNISKHAENNE